MITKAIIPVAGYGTRRLPITKAIEKCMLPVLNRPIIDYVVADCIAAGVKEICIVVGEDSFQVQKYYGKHVRLEQYLRSQGKFDRIDDIKPPKDVEFYFVTQPQDGRYGTAMPVDIAREFIGDSESVLVCMGDDFLWNRDGSSELKRFIESVDGAPGLIGVEINPAEVEKYGVIEMAADGAYQQIVEHPKPADAPSHLINVSKYILNQELLRHIYAYCENEQREEYFIIDPINEYVRGGGGMKVYKSQATYLDGGTLDGWIEANNTLYQAKR
jgi:UTP--glucose-1-phosphate uridylyltransferase